MVTNSEKRYPPNHGHARKLFDAGIDSLYVAVELYNRPSEIGRQQSVVILIHHSLEMLVKSVVRQRRGRIRDRDQRFNYGFKKCVSILETDLNLLSPAAATELRALDFQRDAVMHDFLEMSENLFYYTVHGAVGVAEALSQRAYGVSVTDRLPERALPISAHLPPGIADVIREDLRRADSMLAPGRRKGAEARALLRSVANIEAAVAGDTERPSDDAVLELAGRLQDGNAPETMFPKVTSMALVGSESAADAIFVTVRIGSEGNTVRFAEGDEQADLIRQVNDFDIYQFTSVGLGGQLGITAPKARAVASHLGIVGDESYHKLCRGPDGKRYARYSQAALRLMRDQLDNLDVEAVWRDYYASGGR